MTMRDDTLQMNRQACKAVTFMRGMLKRSSVATRNGGGGT
jgi:hypothetical protein